MSPTLRRLVVSTALFPVLLLAACGETRPLAEIGDFSESFVHGGTTTTTLLSIVNDEGRTIDLGFVRSVDLTWFNDGIAEPPEGDADPIDVIAEIYRRGDGVSQAIQVSRNEIAAALPDIEFPEVVWDEVAFVTSQLVYNELGSLDGDTSAAFGMWTQEPYAVTRAEGQAAVLRVGNRNESEPILGIQSVVVEQGLSLLWHNDQYRYELFCRTGVAEETCWQMAENTAPLIRLLPEA